MKNKDKLKNILSSRDNIKVFIKESSDNPIYIGDCDKYGTSYLLKPVDLNKKKISIEVRKGQENVTKTICFDISKSFVVYDSEGIYFIPIDGKGLLKKDCCDFVFFNEQSFCFVEMKLNATSIDERAIEQNRNKAIEQLEKTINYFDNTLCKDYCELSLEAYIATPDTYPRENAAFESIKVAFLETTGIDLFESREKRYKKTGVREIAQQLYNLSTKEGNELITHIKNRL